MKDNQIRIAYFMKFPTIVLMTRYINPSSNMHQNELMYYLSYSNQIFVARRIFPCLNATQCLANAP